MTSTKSFLPCGVWMSSDCDLSPSVGQCNITQTLNLQNYDNLMFIFLQFITAKRWKSKSDSYMICVTWLQKGQIRAPAVSSSQSSVSGLEMFCCWSIFRSVWLTHSHNKWKRNCHLDSDRLYLAVIIDDKHYSSWDSFYCDMIQQTSKVINCNFNIQRWILLQRCASVLQWQGSASSKSYIC